MVLRLLKAIVYCGSRVCLESSLLRLKCAHSSAQKQRFSYGTLRVMQTLNHIYQPKYTQGHQVSGILYLYDKSNTSRRKSASNSIRLFSVFRSTLPVCLRTGLVSTIYRSLRMHGLGNPGVSIRCVKFYGHMNTPWFYLGLKFFS